MKVSLADRAATVPDGKLNNEFGLDVVAAPTTAVHCRSGDFEAIFALYWLLSGRSETDLVKTWTTFEHPS